VHWAINVALISLAGLATLKNNPPGGGVKKGGNVEMLKSDVVDPLLKSLMNNTQTRNPVQECLSHLFGGAKAWMF
jgi:hypothetical protein